MSNERGEHTVECELCDGKGKIVQNGIVITCPQCSGEGHITEE